MTTTYGTVHRSPHPSAPVQQLAPHALARPRRTDRVTIALLVGVGASAAFAGVSALALAALASLA